MDHNDPIGSSFTIKIATYENKVWRWDPKFQLGIFLKIGLALSHENLSKPQKFRLKRTYSQKIILT